MSSTPMRPFTGKRSPGLGAGLIEPEDPETPPLPLALTKSSPALIGDLAYRTSRWTLEEIQGLLQPGNQPRISELRVRSRGSVGASHIHKTQQNLVLAQDRVVTTPLHPLKSD